VVVLPVDLLPKDKPKCKRCGKCCQFMGKNGLLETCSKLAVDAKGFTTCTIYHKRLGHHIGSFHQCGLIKDLPYNIPGCSFNKEGRPMHPYFK